MFHGLPNQSNLLGVQIGQIGGFQTPLDFGIAAESAGAGARRIDQNSIKFSAKRQRLRGIQDHKRAIEITHLFQAVQVNVARDSASPEFDSLGGFVARRGTNVEKCLARMQIEKRHDGLRADILDAARARDVGLRRLQERGGDLIAGFAAELAIPFFEQPAGVDSARSRSGHGTGLRSVLRRIALTNPAPDALCARFTSSTLSPTAACGGMRSR